MEKQVVVMSGGVTESIAIRSMVYLTVTFDHRVLEGAVADQFIVTVKQTLEGWSENSGA